MKMDIERLLKDPAYWDDMAPEGAEYFMPAISGLCACWYKVVDGVNYCRLGTSDTWDKSYANRRVSQGIPRPDPSPRWDIENLPPINTICYLIGETFEGEVRILAYGKHGSDTAVLVAEVDATGRESIMHGFIARLVELRQPLTEAEEEERDLESLVCNVLRNSPEDAPVELVAKSIRDAVIDEGFTKLLSE